jgi:hypothetical protein
MFFLGNSALLVPGRTFCSDASAPWKGGRIDVFADIVLCSADGYIALRLKPGQSMLQVRRQPSIRLSKKDVREGGGACFLLLSDYNGVVQCVLRF